MLKICGIVWWSCHNMQVLFSDCTKQFSNKHSKSSPFHICLAHENWYEGTGREHVPSPTKKMSVEIDFWWSPRHPLLSTYLGQAYLLIQSMHRSLMCSPTLRKMHLWVLKLTCSLGERHVLQREHLHMERPLKPQLLTDCGLVHSSWTPIFSVFSSINWISPVLVSTAQVEPQFKVKLCFKNSISHFSVSGLCIDCLIFC